MAAQVEELQGRFRTMGCPSALLACTGLSTGEVLVGGTRSQGCVKYPAVGDVMNLGARLEGMNRLYGTRMLVSVEVRAVAGNEFLSDASHFCIGATSGAVASGPQA